MIEIRNIAGAVIWTSEADHLDEADLRGAALAHADLYWASLFQVDLTGANLQGAILCGADLKEAILSKADLRKADFGRDNMGGQTQLQGTDLRGARLDETNFAGALYDERTQFPDGFSPSSHGMIMQD